MKEKWIWRTLGLYLAIDAIISIYFASQLNITLITSSNLKIFLYFTSQFFRFGRMFVGAMLMLDYKIPKLILGSYLMIDGITSVVIAKDFNSWDDYLRVIRILSGTFIFMWGVVKQDEKR